MAHQVISLALIIFIAAITTVVSGDLSPTQSPSSSQAAAPSKSTASPVPSAAPAPSTTKSATPLAAPVPASTISATPDLSPVGSAVNDPSSPPSPLDETLGPVGAAVPSLAPGDAAPGPSDVLAADTPPSGAASLKLSAAVGATVAVGFLFF